MPRHKISQPVAPAPTAYEALRTIAINGTTYAVGETIPLDALHPRRARQMCEWRRIRPIFAAEEAVEAPQAPDAPPAGTDAPAGQEDAPVPADGAAAAPQPAYRVKSFGFGRYDVIDAEDNRISDDWITKEQAEELAASLNRGEV